MRKIGKLLVNFGKLLVKKGESSLKFWIGAAFLILICVLFKCSVFDIGIKSALADAGWICRKVNPVRGEILDRSGHSLASNKISRDLVAVRGRIDPGLIPPLSKFLAPNIGRSETEISDLLNQSSYEVKLLEGLDEEEFNKICKFRKVEWQIKLRDFYNSDKGNLKEFKNWNTFHSKMEVAIREIITKKNYTRLYPSGEIAAHIIGYSSDVMGMFKAWKGLELHYDELLRGVEGELVERRDYFDRLIPSSEPEVRGLVNGYDIRLTLSSEIQAFVFTALKDRVTETSAKGGCVIVLDAPSGEILAMVSYPTFDPENYTEYLEEGPARPEYLPPDQYRLNPMHNLATQLACEPGSVMKPFFASWALENGIITIDELFEIKPEGFKVAGKKKPIKDSHKIPNAQQWKINQVMVESSNQGMAQVGLKLGRENIINLLYDFHFGQKSLGLNEEQTGQINNTLREVDILRPSWAKAREANAAFGQGITATPLQIAAAMNVFANNGYYVKPKIMLDATLENGEPKFADPSGREKIISEETEKHMVSMLEEVVIHGTGTDSFCKGYRVAGKTGTAEKPDLINGGYNTKRHFASFAGFGPLPEPRYTILVLLDEPQSKWGGSSCGPVFRKIFEYLMVRDGIPPVLVNSEEEDDQNL
jgi:cell division protein FtsI/penicillin-binding protein 2